MCTHANTHATHTYGHAHTEFTCKCTHVHRHITHMCANAKAHTCKHTWAHSLAHTHTHAISCIHDVHTIYRYAYTCEQSCLCNHIVPLPFSDQRFQVFHIAKHISLHQHGWQRLCVDKWVLDASSRILKRRRDPWGTGAVGKAKCWKARTPWFVTRLLLVEDVW